MTGDLAQRFVAKLLEPEPEVLGPARDQFGLVLATDQLVEFQSIVRPGRRLASSCLSFVADRSLSEG